MKENNGRKPAVRVCCITATIIIVITAIVLVTLAFTVFKPHDPEVVLYPVGLAKIQMEDFIAKDNVTSDMIMSVRNRNYASFRFENSTSSITYDGEVVGEVPIPAGRMPARSAMNISSAATLMVGKLRANPKAINDILGGSLNFTAKVTMQGRMSMMKQTIKKRGWVYTECYLTMYVNETPIRGDSWCWSKLHM
ncbi:hypothetical protein LINGRAHAP2_LOCUS15871 [Linum grandiflorum]